MKFTGWFTRKGSMVLLAGATLATAVGADTASAMILVNVPGVKGDSMVAGFLDQIACTSYSVAASVGVKGGGGVAPLFGAPTFNEIVVNKALDSASPLLFQNMCAKKVYATLTLSLLAPGGASPTPKDSVYMTITLQNAVVTSIRQVGTEDERPSEQVTFYADAIHFAYKPFNGTTYGTAIEGGFNQVTGKAY